MSDQEFRYIWAELQQSQGTSLIAAQALVRHLQRYQGDEDPLGGVSVWVLTFSDGYTSAQLFQTEEQAWQAAYKIVRGAWFYGAWGEIPVDIDDAIGIYLTNRNAQGRNESFQVEQKTIAPLGIAG